MHFHKNHIYFSASPDIIEIVKPLKQLGITYFTYGRKYYDGARICLQNGHNALDDYYKKKYYLQGNTECKPEYYKERVVLWSTLPNQKVIDECARSRGFDHGMYMFQPHDNYSELFAFATCQGNEQIVNTYLTKMDLLIKFQQYFREKAESVIKTAENQKFILPFNNNLSIKSYFDINDIKNDNFYLAEASSILTSRQAQCSDFLLKGKTAKEIGILLNLSSRTVEYYINNMKNKFGCKNKTELVMKLSKLINS